MFTWIVFLSQGSEICFGIGVKHLVDLEVEFSSSGGSSVFEDFNTVLPYFIGYFVEGVFSKCRNYKILGNQRQRRGHDIVDCFVIMVVRLNLRNLFDLRDDPFYGSDLCSYLKLICRYKPFTMAHDDWYAVIGCERKSITCSGLKFDNIA